MNKGIPIGSSVRIQIHSSGFTAMESIDKKEDQIEKATVLEVDKSVKLVKKGDVILFKAYNLDTIEVDGERFDLIPIEDIKYVWRK